MQRMEDGLGKFLSTPSVGRATFSTLAVVA